MAQTAAKKLLVVGGTGFLGKTLLFYIQYQKSSRKPHLGQSICKHATRQGWETVSLRYHWPFAPMSIRD